MYLVKLQSARNFWYYHETIEEADYPSLLSLRESGFLDGEDGASTLKIRKTESMIGLGLSIVPRLFLMLTMSSML